MTTSSGDEIKACGNCRFFVAGGQCQRVIGEINAHDLCDLWSYGQPQVLGSEAVPTFEKTEVAYRGALVIEGWPPKIIGPDSLPDIDAIKVPDTGYPPIRPDPAPRTEPYTPPESRQVDKLYEPYLTVLEGIEEGGIGSGAKKVGAAIAGQLPNVATHGADFANIAAKVFGMTETAQVFDESQHPRDADGKFSSTGRAGATAAASLLQERDVLTKQLKPLSHEYRPFEKYTPEDASLKWVNKGIRNDLARIDARLANLSPIIGAPLLPLGKNTHPHDPRGFRNNQVTNIVIHEPKANETPHERRVHLEQTELVKTLWNQLPDDERDMLKEFEIAPIDTADWRQGITMGYYSHEQKKVFIGTLTDLASQDLRGTFIHEMAHAKWADFRENSPEKIEQFRKDVKGFPSSSKYSKYHVSKIRYYEAQDKKWKKARDFAIPNNSWSKKAEKTYNTVQTNMKVFRDTYYTELHSELQMHVMGATKQEGKKGERKIPKNLTGAVKAYKRLHGIE